MSNLTEIVSDASTDFADIIHEFAKGIIAGVIVLILLAVYGLVWNAIGKATA